MLFPLVSCRGLPILLFPVEKHFLPFSYSKKARPSQLFTYALCFFPREKVKTFLPKGRKAASPPSQLFTYGPCPKTPEGLLNFLP
jgi:hypothetical protein